MVITVSEEQRQQTPQMDVECLAKFLFCALKERISSDSKPPDSFSVVELRKDLFPGEREEQTRDEKQSRDNHRRLLEAVALLERRGLVVRECSYSEPGMPSSHQFETRQVDPSIVSVYLTSIGMNSDFDDGILLLVDKPEEIVSALEKKIGTLDDVARQYYLESLRAYQEGLYISSVICLGAASERAIHWLAESVSGLYRNGSEKHRKEIEREYFCLNRIPFQ